LIGQNQRIFKKYCHNIKLNAQNYRLVKKLNKTEIAQSKIERSKLHFYPNKITKSII